VLELILGILLAAGAMYFVLLPILRPPIEAAGGETSVDEGDDPADDMSAQAVALRALKEIEFDRATGKLSDADYGSLKAKYTAEALAAMRGKSGVGSQEPGITAVPDSRLLTPKCPEHGTPREADAVFCPECGRRLGKAPGYCARCGTTLESDARYCNACGARVAA